jgi:hypothetical protein
MPPCYCRPSYNASRWATWDVTAGTEDMNYPMTNAGNQDPSNPAKSVGTVLTARATFATAQPIAIAQFVMHNLAGRLITISNSAGLVASLTPGPNTRDGFPEFSWVDLRNFASNSGTWWTFAMTVSTGVVHVGEIVLWTEVNFLPLLWKVQHGPRRLAHRNVTDWGYEHYYDRGIRERVIEGNIIDGDYRQAILDLEADAHGCVKQWPLILEDDARDSYWVRFQEDELMTGRDAPRITRISFDVHETGLGLAP